jgi:PadR family transcriptional regulator
MLGLDHWALSGDWTMEEQLVTLNEADGQVMCRFHARDLHLMEGEETLGPLQADSEPVSTRVLKDGRGAESSLPGPAPYVKLLLMPVVRMTLAVARVLREFLSDPAQPRYGYELMNCTQFPSGKLYPVLARLVEAGWLVREREEIDAAQAGRPARYFYRLTEEGAVAAERELSGLSEQLAPPRQPGPRVWPDRIRT